jgi:hypothetical protein
MSASVSRPRARAPASRAVVFELSVPWSVKLSTPARRAAATASSCVSK